MKTFNNWQDCPACSSKQLCAIISITFRLKYMSYKFECNCGKKFTKKFYRL